MSSNSADLTLMELYESMYGYAKRAAAIRRSNGFNTSSSIPVVPKPSPSRPISTRDSAKTSVIGAKNAVNQHLEKVLKTCQVPIMSKEKKPETEQSKIIKALVWDEESDKRDLISAMESVLTTLKVYEAKKREASSAKAEAAVGVGNILDSLESSQKHWAKMVVTHIKLNEDVKKDNSSLTDKAADIERQILLLLRNEDEMFDVLDDIHDSLYSQLARVDEEIEKANLMNLLKAEAQKCHSYVEHIVKKAKENIQPLKVEAKKNEKLRELLEDYHHEVDLLKEDLETTRNSIEYVKEEYERRISRVKCDTPSETGAVLDSSISSQESDDSTQLEAPKQLVSSVTRSASHSSISSQDTEGSEVSDASESEASLALSLQGSDSDGCISVQESEDYDSESQASEASEDCKWETVSESETSEETEDSAYESEASEESDDSGQANASQNVAVSGLADPSEAVSSQNTIISISTETEHHELPNENSPAISTEATNATNETKTLSDDDWDLCGHSDSDE